MFSLHPQLHKDCYEIGDLTLCRVLLVNDCNYPWLILVPRREDISEIYQLTEQDQRQLTHESSHVARLMADHFRADKMNIAALGNQVPQLHIHHIARFHSDGAWPGPVWGVAQAMPYSEDKKQQLLRELKDILGVE